jgi:hypothetical protein
MIQSEKCSSLGCALHMAREPPAGDRMAATRPIVISMASAQRCMQQRHLRYE